MIKLEYTSKKSLMGRTKRYFYIQFVVTAFSVAFFVIAQELPVLLSDINENSQPILVGDAGLPAGLAEASPSSTEPENKLVFAGEGAVESENVGILAGHEASLESEKKEPQASSGETAWAMDAGSDVLPDKQGAQALRPAQQVLGLTTEPVPLASGDSGGIVNVPANNLHYYTVPALVFPSSGAGENPKSILSATSLMCETCTVNSSLSVSGQTTVTGQLTATSLTVSGNATLPVVSLAPSSPGVSSLGSSSNTFGQMYAQKLNVTEIIGLGSVGSQHVLLNPYATGYVGIGTDTPTQQLEITKNFALPATALDGSTGVIYQNGSTLLHSRTCTGSVSSLYFGRGAGNFTSCGASDDANTGIGAEALKALTTGIRNTAVGGYSLAGTTSGSENVAVGAYTSSSIVGHRNVAVGHGALAANNDGSDNIAIGGYSLITNTSGSGNVMIGNADYSSPNTTGNQNIYLGFKAGYTSNAANKNNSGNYNTFLGALSGPSTSTQLSKAVAIGYNALVGASNAFVLGGTGADAVNVGINTTTPDSSVRLHVVGNERIDGGLCIRNATACPAYSAGRLYVDTAGTVGGDDPGDVFDIAEMYAADSVSPGDVVVSGGAIEDRKTEFGEIQLPLVKKSNKNYQNEIVGVVSTRPAIGISGHFVVTGPERQKENSDTAYVALAGRVPVKVTTENGVIKAGDFLTSSKLFPGYAMKATRSGQVIGQALGNFGEQNLRGDQSLDENAESGTVLVFIKPGYQIINNSFVLDSHDQLLGEVSGGVVGGEESGFLIDQIGSGNILSLQSRGVDRLIVKNDGAVSVLASVEGDILPIFSVSNNEKILLAVYGNKLEIRVPIILVSRNSAGTAEVKQGDDLVKVEFSVPYGSVPKIQVTAQGRAVGFWLSEKTSSYFIIRLKEPATTNVMFDWFAVEQPDNTESVSSLMVKNAPAYDSAVIENSSEVGEVESGQAVVEKPIEDLPSKPVEPNSEGGGVFGEHSNENVKAEEVNSSGDTLIEEVE